MYRNKSPQDSALRAPQFSSGRRPETPPGAELALQVEDVFETRLTRGEAPSVAPTVVVRRKRRLDLADDAAAHSTSEVDSQSPNSEHRPRVFTIKQQEAPATTHDASARPTIAAAPRLEDRAVDAHGVHVDENGQAPTRETVVRRRRRVPDHARPSEAVVTRPTVAEQLQAVEAAAVAQDKEPSASPFKFDLFINARWAHVNKALDALKMTLPAKKTSRTRSPKT